VVLSAITISRSIVLFMDCLNESMVLFQAPNMTSVGEVSESMSAGSPHSYVPPGGGSAGQEGVNVGAAVVASQERGVGNMAPLQEIRVGSGARTMGKCETKLFDLTAGCDFQNSLVM
jgi:hypothetical protein